jgi:hypothetical protein
VDVLLASGLHDDLLQRQRLKAQAQAQGPGPVGVI